MSDSKLHLISGDARKQIDQWIGKYPPEQRRSAVMAALEIMQLENGGSLTRDLMDAVAEYLRMEKISVYEVATFYSMYELEPKGRHKICVCTNISCMLCGSSGIVDHLKSRLGVGLGETTADGRFSLKEVECLAACAGAPMFQIGKQFYENLTPEKVDKILSSLE